MGLRIGPVTGREVFGVDEHVTTHEHTDRTYPSGFRVPERRVSRVRPVHRVPRYRPVRQWEDRVADGLNKNISYSFGHYYDKGSLATQVASKYEARKWRA